MPIRILLVVPGLGLSTTSEIRDITGLHQVTVLNDVVTSRDIFREARTGFDIIHFASHSDEKRVSLSNAEYLVDNDLVQLARISGAKLVFFNSCSAGRLACYLIGHGVPLAVHTNTELDDVNAWKFPLAFYGAMANINSNTTHAYIRAFDRTNDGEGIYGLAISPSAILLWAAMAADPTWTSQERTKSEFRQWAIQAVIAGVLLILLAMSWYLILYR
jgi:hypothetical protein